MSRPSIRPSEVGVPSREPTEYRRADVIRLVPFALALLAVFVIARWLLQTAGRAAASRVRTRKATRRPGGYEFDRRWDQAYRRLKSVGGPTEQRAEIVLFLDSHRRVEAYVEPKTAMSPLSVVLVDEAGDWRRFELMEDTYIRQLASERRIRVFDAARTGYPKRMKRTGRGSSEG